MFSCIYKYFSKNKHMDNFTGHWHMDNMVDCTEPKGPVRYYRCSNSNCSNHHKLPLSFKFTKNYYVIKTCKNNCNCHLQNDQGSYHDEW